MIRAAESRSWPPHCFTWALGAFARLPSPCCCGCAAVFSAEDWDDEDDGEWEAPTIPNPEYKGEWKPKM